jgi:hypothetical protein
LKTAIWLVILFAAAIFGLLESKLPERFFKANENIAVGRLSITFAEPWEIMWLRTSEGKWLFRGYLPSVVTLANPSLGSGTKVTAKLIDSNGKKIGQLIAIEEDATSGVYKEPAGDKSEMTVFGLKATKSKVAIQGFRTYYFFEAGARITTDVILESQNSLTISIR